MTIDEAIKILERGCGSNEWAEYRQTIEATKLGIEALKRLKEMRVDEVFRAGILLLGEIEK